jgi:transposase
VSQQTPALGKTVVGSQTIDHVTPQVHLPGEKMFVDWAGQKVEIHNAQDGSISWGHLFVAVLDARNKTYAEAIEDEQLGCLDTGALPRLRFFQGVARTIVPVNLKTGVIRPCRYEPLLHRSYLIALQQHAGAVAKAPEKWLPWNYEQAIAAVGCG